MKLLKQFLIILAISFLGEILKYLLPLPVPASIYGMVILFIGLLTGLIPLNSVALLTVMIATGHVSQLVIRMQKRKRADAGENK